MGGTIGGAVDSFTDTMFGGSRQRSSSGVPGWARGAWQDNWQQAQDTAEGLDPRQIAGLGLDFTRGADVMRGSVGQGAPGMQATQQAMQSAQGVGDGLGRFTEQMGLGDIERFQNPHTDQVVNATMDDLNRQRQRAMMDVGDQAAAAGAFGGSRHGVAEGETNRAFADQAAQTAAQLRQGGFDQASQMAMSDLQRQQQAGMQQANIGLNQAGMLGGLGQQMQQMGMQGAQGLLGLDEMQRGVEQQQLDAEYEVPLLQQQLRNQALGLAPAGGATQSQQQGRSSPGFIGGQANAIGAMFGG